MTDAIYQLPVLKQPAPVKANQAVLVASGDLRPAANERCWPAQEEMERSLSRAANDGIREIDMLQQELHDDLAAFVYDRLRRRPMVLPVVVEV